MLTALRSVRVGLIAAGVLLLAATAARAATPEQNCKSGKNKTAGKYAACRTNAEAKLAKGGDPSKYTEALDKCETKFSAAWQKLEEKATAAGASCPAGETTIKGTTDTYTGTVASLIGWVGSRFVDNGDGTVTDTQTGLQWEKKTTAVGSGMNYNDPHDVDNAYGWSALFEDPDGTAFTDFLRRLNLSTSSSADGTTVTISESCFAGHCDWRLPTIAELQTILLDPYPCGPTPCIDPVFGPTAADYYWSATTFTFNPSFAWGVSFGNGYVDYGYEYSGAHVRAVRTGS